MIKYDDVGLCDKTTIIFGNMIIDFMIDDRNDSDANKSLRSNCVWPDLSEQIF